MSEGLSGTLQHPRRSLGDRHRSQALKFLNLANSDPSRFDENSDWAEQNARQSILYDFTHEENWRLLANIKLQKSDEMGLRSLLSDLFAVLGRDPEQISQLQDISILEMGVELVDATFSRDPLDPNAWTDRLDDSILSDFIERFDHLDLTDPRCNVLFGRRVERLWPLKGDEMCMPLARRLLSQRPQNHEMWVDLGRAHERSHSYDEAWFCYDQAQSYAPHLLVRDEFKERMDTQLDSGRKIPWSTPSIDVRDQFLERMEHLATQITTGSVEATITEISDVEVVNLDILKLDQLLQSRNFSAAFFLARRLIARGEDWASEYLARAKEGLSESDNVNIP